MVGDFALVSCTPRRVKTAVVFVLTPLLLDLVSSP
jgi:hypothetical protein